MTDTNRLIQTDDNAGDINRVAESMTERLFELLKSEIDFKLSQKQYENFANIVEKFLQSLG